MFAGGRQSLAPNHLFSAQTPASGSVQRRSSVFSRPSGHGPMPHQSFFSQPAPLGTNPKDPRPLHDASFRARIGQELLDYLTSNNFELEMKCSLRQDSLKQPTQKEFTSIFQWLYKRLDPGYRFQKSVDNEVPPILKQLRYPYAWQITKSQLGAVGSQTSWRTFLGLLHWMMQLAQMLDNFRRGAYDDACMDAGVDVSGDRIVFRFLFGAYQDWLAIGDDEDDAAADAKLVPHVQAMTQEFERINAKHVEDLKMYEAEHERLRAEVEEMEKSAPNLVKLDNNYQVLESDLKKFEQYDASVTTKIEKYDSRLKILQDELEKMEGELSGVEQERHSLQQSMDRQGLNIQEIDRMNNDRERLIKNHDDAATTLDVLNKTVLQKEADTVEELDKLETIIKRYNTLGYQLSLIPSTARNAKNSNFELTLNLPPTSFSTSQSRPSSSRGKSSTTDPTDRLLSTPTTGHTPAHLLNLDLRGHIRQTFIQLRKEINTRRKARDDADWQHRDLIDKVQDNLHEKIGELDSLHHRINTASGAYTTLKENGQTSHTQQTSAIEKLEKELSRMREGLERGVLEIEQREMEVGLAWEGMQEEAGRIREELHGGVETMLDEVVRFKVHVQKGLEEFEGWVLEECEGELREGDKVDANVFEG